MHDPPLKVVTLAGRYRLDRKIGEGGMGEVYVAHDEKTGTRVAVKILTVDDDEKLRARFEQEARATMELTHPNIVRVTDFRAAAGERPFLVMELLVGESLRERMKREKKMPVAEAARIAMELCEALSAAHAAGIIHRDVKPPNVFLAGRTARVKLLDFGIAKVRAELGKVHTTTGTVLGTPSYFAPEQLLGKEIDGRTDVHAVGIVLYEMLAARRPWMEENPVDLTAAILHAAAPPLAKLRNDVPDELARAIDDALAKDRFSRPTADELAKRLAPFAPRRRTSLGAFAVVAVAASLGAGAVAVAWPTSEDGAGVHGGAAAAGPTDADAPDADAPDADVPDADAPDADVPDAGAADADVAAEDASGGAAEAGASEDDDAKRTRSYRARVAGLRGDAATVRSFLAAYVLDGGADDEDARLLREACKQLGDRDCVAKIRDLYPLGAAGAGDGHLRDADGGGGGGGAQIEVGADRVDALP